ncbi:MAG TPA: ATP-binding protein [Phycisphaerae bacterium]|nr:ATP-binding protein [Phycisphaerae bacterium]
MSLLERMHKGRQFTPPRLEIHGSEGIGKSTLASRAPNPAFIATEDGLGQIDCNAFPLARAYEDVVSSLEALRDEQHEYQTVVIDTVDWLERLIWARVCRDKKVSNIEDIGYQKGYVFALDYWRTVLDLLDELRHKRKMMAILLAHSKVEKFEDPETLSYDRYSPKLHKHANAMVIEWCDAVLFATRIIATRTEDKGFGQKRTIATGAGEGDRRILKCVGGPACVAKNRYSLRAELPLDWNTLFNEIIKSQSANPNTQIEGAMTNA